MIVSSISIDVSWLLIGHKNPLSGLGSVGSAQISLEWCLFDWWGMWLSRQPRWGSFDETGQAEYTQKVALVYSPMSKGLSLKIHDSTKKHQVIFAVVDILVLGPT